MGSLRVIGRAMLILCALLLSAPTMANDNFGLIIEAYDLLPRKYDEVALLSYHGGIGDGLVATRENYRSQGEAPLFCVADDKRLSDMALRESIRKELAEDGHTWRRVSNATVEMIALYALRRDYPCGNVHSKAATPGKTILAYGMARANIHTDFGAELLVFYYMGLHAAIVLSQNAYAERGVKRRICFPPKLELMDMIKATDVERERNPGLWRTRPDDNFGMVAFKAFERQFPCK